MKVCFKCSKAKPLAEFYKHPAMSDGHLGKCKSCTKRDARGVRLAKIEHYRDYDRKRAILPHRKAQATRIHARWKGRHPERRKAQTILGCAVKRGDVVPQPCLICGEKAEAHHTDYSLPLDVIWLCPAHHKQAHAMAKAA